MWVCVVGLLLWGHATAAEEQQGGDRAISESFPVSIFLPKNWESFPGDPKVPGEVLFLQGPVDDPRNATLSLATFTKPDVWADLLRRQRYQLIVDRDAKVLVDEALTLHGVKGHKWAYRYRDRTGVLRFGYDLYLALPASSSGRVLALHGLANWMEEATLLELFNRLASSLIWGGGAGRA